MKSATWMCLLLAVCLVFVAGCDKKIALTIRNHSDMPRQVQMSDPYETMTVGTIGPEGVMRTTLRVKKDDLPAQCSLTAAGGVTETFRVNDDSPDKWWFHIGENGDIAGPYGKNDVHVESDQTIDVTTPVQQKTLVR
ncbi:MAG: hypothetical protein GVY16_08575 [Planctomycetes bacterium]|nr:hypothetical protein [Planctomycetota bacterium]